MKKVLKFTTVIALMFITSIGSASTPNLNVLSNAPKSLNFSMDTFEQATAIRLIDAHGYTIFSENTTNQKMYSKRFDLSNLENGTLSLTIENDLKKVVYTIELTNSEVVIKETNEILKPVFRKKGDKMYLNFLNLQKENVKIKVMNSSENIVFAETITDTVQIEKIFNFENSVKEDFTIVVEVKGNSYYKTVAQK